MHHISPADQQQVRIRMTYSSRSPYPIPIPIPIPNLLDIYPPNTGHPQSLAVSTLAHFPPYHRDKPAIETHPYIHVL